MREPLLLLPGMMCDARLFAPQIDALADLAAVTVDDLTGALAIEGLAASVLAAAPERFALAGLSMGASSPWRSCGRRPGG